MKRTEAAEFGIKFIESSQDYERRKKTAGDYVAFCNSDVVKGLRLIYHLVPSVGEGLSMVITVFTLVLV